MSTRHIAVIEDDQAVAEVIGDVLQDEGYRVSLCPDPEAGYAWLTTLPRPDLVLLDIVLRRTRAGWDVLQALLLDKDLRTIPVLLCTADSAAQAQVERLHDRAIPLLLKPFLLDELLAAVAQAISTAPDGAVKP